mmetsp:Transcript_5702/g.8270  ORF Transcript_5702/g.8270 Transcript_5702/m.8270 type:complete len:218 (-) Transcript_5702:103-756(-)
MAPNHSDDEGTDSEEGSEVDDNEEEEGSEEEEEPEPVKPAPKKRKSRKKKKDPKKPKRNMSACFLYFQAFRPQVRAENPDAKFADIAHILSAQYKALTDKQKKKWEKKAEEEKARYLKEMESYVPPDDSDSDDGGKKKKKKKDPNAPKRNKNAYLLFSVDARAKVKEENPDASFGDIAKIISSRFKQLTAKEKKKWDDKAATDKVRYQREMADYEAN